MAALAPLAAAPLRLVQRPQRSSRATLAAHSGPARRGARLRVRAAGDDGKPAASQEDDAEASVEAMERRFRSYDPKPTVTRQPMRSANFPTPKPKVVPLAERIKDKDAFEAAWIVWSGEEGVLWWASKIAYALCFALIGGWILFRFVGPATGLYTLKSGLTDVMGGR